jgi:hypothetical protein
VRVVTLPQLSEGKDLYAISVEAGFSFIVVSVVFWIAL